MEYEMRRLREDAIEEASRVMRARAYAADGTPAVGDARGPLTTRTRHRDTRRSLAGRCLFVFRVCCNDSNSRMVATRLVGVHDAVATDTAILRPRDRIRAAVARADAVIGPHVERLSGDWIRETERFAAAFCRARLQRERAIEAQVLVTKPQLFQAGLFDRRAERARRSESDALADREQAMRTRIDAAERLHVLETVADLLLVLTP